MFSEEGLWKCGIAVELWKFAGLIEANRLKTNEFFDVLSRNHFSRFMLSVSY
jgi:hypothetical protein